MFRKIIDHPFAFWALLALPSIGMLAGAVSGESFKGLLHPTGEFSARFMIIAMMLTPLRMLFPRSGLLRWLMRRRRHIGVAAFGYGLLHTVFYVIEKGTLTAILREVTDFDIWTGWLAFLIFVPLAITSNDASLRALGTAWKTLQRFTYPAAVATLLHWLFISHEIGGALVHFIPLAGLEAYRLWRLYGPRFGTRNSVPA